MIPTSSSTSCCVKCRCTRTSRRWCDALRGPSTLSWRPDGYRLEAVNILVVLAHPEGQSFNGALRDVSVATLSSAGHSVLQSDLYAMDFKAVLARDDFVEQGDTEFFNVQSSQRTAVANGTQAEDVVREQAKLEQADLVILHFPIWWFGVPAILKGWIDRTFALGHELSVVDAGLITACTVASGSCSVSPLAPDPIGSARRVSLARSTGCCIHCAWAPSIFAASTHLSPSSPGRQATRTVRAVPTT